MVGIYKITSPTGRIYIGQSWNLESRIKWYRKPSKSQRKIYNSIKKYGYSNHVLEIVCTLPEDTSQDILDNYELLYYTQYKNCGFKMLNIREPGSRGKLALQTKIKLSKDRIGKNNPMYGIVMSEANKQVLRSRWLGNNNPSRKRDMKGANNGSYGCKRSVAVIQAHIERRSKPVIQYTISGEFIAGWPSAKQAESAVGVPQSNISSCCRGINRKQAGGFIWKFKNQ